MKRPKRASVQKKTYTGYIYSVTCPHCKTTLTGGFGVDVDRLFCSQCDEVIMLEWEDCKGRERFRKVKV